MALNRAPRVPASPYLPSAVARGCPYCFDPDSPALHEAFACPRPLPETPLPARGLADDIAWLQRLLRAQYAGYVDWLRHPSFDVEAFFAAWVGAARRSGPTVPFAAVASPLAVLQLTVLDQHLTIWGAERALAADNRLSCHEYQAVLPAGTGVALRELAAVAGAHPATARIAPLLRPDGTLAQVATVSAGGGGGERGGGRLLRRPDAPRGHRPPEVPAYEWHSSGDTAVIVIRTFGGPQPVQEALRQLAADYPRHSARSALLFDLRGNNGGNLSHLGRWLARAKGGESHGMPVLETAAWPCGDWNRLVEAQVREGSAGSPAARAERERAWAEWQQWPLPAPIAVTRSDSYAPPGAPYAGRVFAVVDRHSGSSGERAAVDLQRELGAVLIGERTSGRMQYGQASRYVLPSTGLVCQLSTRRVLFDREVAGVGYPVDVYLEEAGQAADALVPHLDAVWQAARRGAP